MVYDFISILEAFLGTKRVDFRMGKVPSTRGLGKVAEGVPAQGSYFRFQSRVLHFANGEGHQSGF